jgi:NAD(P)H dehydrogenase (quinone)
MVARMPGSSATVWAGKPVTAFNRHGGNEATILSLGNVFYHWGALIVPPGFTDPVVYAAGGNPYGTSFVTGPAGDGPDAAALEAARYQGRRLARITIRLLEGGRGTDAAAGDGNARGTRAAATSRTA